MSVLLICVMTITSCKVTSQEPKKDIVIGKNLKWSSPYSMPSINSDRLAMPGIKAILPIFAAASKEGVKPGDYVNVLVEKTTTATLIGKVI